ncbi:hypothetical protein [Nocardia sp. X0981]
MTRTLTIPRGRLSNLPTRDRLLIALCTNADDSNPICAWARELVRLHRMCTDMPAAAAQCEGRRIELITQIDELAATIEPSRMVAHPRTIGTLIDRMAAAAERAMRELAASGARSEQMHEAWTQLAELDVEYSDLLRYTSSKGECCTIRSQ